MCIRDRSLSLSLSLSCARLDFVRAHTASVVDFSQAESCLRSRRAASVVDVAEKKKNTFIPASEPSTAIRVDFAHPPLTLRAVACLFRRSGGQELQNHARYLPTRALRDV
eukprot:2855246-Rhodomonas_salina.1